MSTETRPSVQHTGIGVIPPEHRLQIDGNVDVFNPQALLNALAIIRNKETSQEDFVRYSDFIFNLLGSRVAEDVPTRETEFETPQEIMRSVESDGSGVLIIAILRSGSPAAQGIRTAIPDATIGVVDIKRDEETAEPTMTYDGLESHDLSLFNQVIIPDPMLATGGSALKAINLLKGRGAKNIHLVSLVAAPEGIQRVQEEHSDVKITAAAIDSHLDDKKFIVPGLGDFGDRYYENDPLVIYDELNGGLPLRYKDGRLDVPQSRDSEPLM